MKRNVRIMAVLGLLLVALFTKYLSSSPQAPGGTASITLIGVTNDSSGARIALLGLTNASPAAAICSAYFIDYNIGNAWVPQPGVPAAGLADIPSVLALRPEESRILAVHFPTNATWRFRVIYQEQARGLEGTLSRAVDFVSNLFSAVKCTGYTGRRYSAQTQEIAK
jgi:hypothetical protein